MSKRLRLVVFDATQSRADRGKNAFARAASNGLGRAWEVGSALYRAAGHVDACIGARSWEDAFDAVARHEPNCRVAELQFWGHGRWGRALVDEQSFDRRALERGNPLRNRLEAFRERLSPGALVWFRTCETIGARAGQDFASALGDFLGARIAGHTFVIGFFQSGLHVREPGKAPGWSASEGLHRGTPEKPEAALASSPLRPNTITCLTERIPASFLG